MSSYRQIVACSVLLVALSAVAADGPQKPKPANDTEQNTCTDISGKVPLPCPDHPLASLPPEDDGGAAAEAATNQAPAKPPQANSGADARAGIGAPVAGAAAKPEAAGSLPDDSETPTVGPKNYSLVRSLPLNFVKDQKEIWTSPLRLRLQDAQWLVPLVATGAVLVASDRDIERKLPSSASFIKRSQDFSNYAVAGYAGATGAAFLLGSATHNDRLRDTAVLAGEAAANSLLLTLAIKNITRRDRPLEDDQVGRFWSRGQSFPSGHSAAAWSMASVVAHEYPGLLTTVLAYGSASAVSASRVTGRKHFVSDAVVGGALGWVIGRQVYRARHADADVARFGTFERASRAERPADPGNMGSPYVPLDSWVYAAFDRLAAMGYLQSIFAGLRPWTRLECVRLLSEVERQVQDSSGTADYESTRLYRALQAEFVLDSERIAQGRNIGAEIASVYTRVTGISGKPLNDSYHFGQTIINDYGRPYQDGANLVTGFSAQAVAGPLAFYVTGEYQHAPAAPAYSDAVRNAIAAMDANPVQAAVPFTERNDFRLLDIYLALNVRNYQISFGRQSLWWGPGQGSALMFSNNAAPFTMLRISRVSPAEMPSILRFLGPMRAEAFIGRLDGHHFPVHPYITAQKVSFKPTPNLEIGFSKLAVFAGGNTPLGWHSFYKANFSVDDGGPAQLGTANLPGVDPGDRRSGFDFSYRLPGLRNWLTLYNDSLSDDDPSPLAAPRRAAVNPGLYLSHVPGLPRLDLRLEAVNTDTPGGPSRGGKFIYWNTVFRDSHTNNGNVMGSWIGREGRGLQASSTYWLSPRNTIRVGYRNARVSNDFVPGGGWLEDFAGATELQIAPELAAGGRMQFERWSMPILSPGVQSNFTLMLSLTYRPKWKLTAK